MSAAACILGCSGLILTRDERAFFADAAPWGFILFARNVASPSQVRALTADLRQAVGRDDAPVLIDQEGGRVQRLGPPSWGRYPPAAAYGRLGEAGPEAAWLGGRRLAHDLTALGVNINCMPVLDVGDTATHAAIGDRAFSFDPGEVGRLGRAACEGLMAGGVLPVIKHMPGQGRARTDSHLGLPVVEASLAELDAHDFVPFRWLADMPLAMTGHVVFSAIDPDRPATTSPTVIAQVIRGIIGFQGLLISDDVAMDALSGGLRDRSDAARRAGCDVVLYGRGDGAGNAAVAAGAGRLTGASAQRASDALARGRKPVEAFDAGAARARFEAAFAGHWSA